MAYSISVLILTAAFLSLITHITARCGVEPQINSGPDTDKPAAARIHNANRLRTFTVRGHGSSQMLFRNAKVNNEAQPFRYRITRSNDIWGLELDEKAFTLRILQTADSLISATRFKNAQNSGHIFVENPNIPGRKSTPDAAALWFAYLSEDTFPQAGDRLPMWWGYRPTAKPSMCKATWELNASGLPVQAHYYAEGPTGTKTESDLSAPMPVRLMYKASDFSSSGKPGILLPKDFSMSFFNPSLPAALGNAAMPFSITIGTTDTATSESETELIENTFAGEWEVYDLRKEFTLRYTLKDGSVPPIEKALSIGRVGP